MIDNGYYSEHTDTTGLARALDSNLLEETHYYPFGLPIKGLGSEASGFTANKHKYQGNEYTQEGLNWMDFHNRQLGLP